jgi:Tfp pilus assembly protein PilW
MNIQTLKNSSGVCLVELMIAIAAGLVVLSATIQMLTHF